MTWALSNMCPKHGSTGWHGPPIVTNAIVAAHDAIGAGRAVAGRSGAVRAVVGSFCTASGEGWWAAHGWPNLLGT